MVRDSNVVKYQQYIAPPAKVGDIAYWDGSGIKTVPLSGWKDSLGTPVGVVLIGENFIPDGKARIISLNDAGNFAWVDDDYYNNPIIKSFTSVPITDNAGSTTTGSSEWVGFLPSDNSDWNGPQSYVDPLTKYHESADLFIPSPYLNDGSFNPAYATELDGGNALSDFNGLSNTETLKNISDRIFYAANACWNYKDIANSNLQWYLPAAGELGFLMSRYKLINTSIQAVDGTPFEEGSFWSSTAYIDNYSNLSAYSLLFISEGLFMTSPPEYKYITRPIAII